MVGTERIMANSAGGFSGLRYAIDLHAISFLGTSIRTDLSATGMDHDPPRNVAGVGIRPGGRFDARTHQDFMALPASHRHAAIDTAIHRQAGLRRDSHFVDLAMRDKVVLPAVIAGHFPLGLLQVCRNNAYAENRRTATHL